MSNYSPIKTLQRKLKWKPKSKNLEALPEKTHKNWNKQFRSYLYGT